MGFGSGWCLAAKPCDSCKSAAAAVFCRADAAALCFGCDARLHCRTSPAPPHERVWMCEVCEQAPAAVTCKADAASLCVSCDSDIHSANPLAQRHERVPVQPFFDSAESIVKSSALGFHILPEGEAVAAAAAAAGGAVNDGACAHDRHSVAETDSWPTPNLNPKVMQGADMGCFLGEMDPFLDFGYGDTVDRFHGTGSDGLVPVQPNKVPLPVGEKLLENRFDIDFSRPNNPIPSSFSYLTHSLSHSVSSSSLDVGVVPDGNSNMSEISYPLVQTSADSALANSASSSCQSGPVTDLNRMDREARVLRYREKRKNRKFVKTIRYASRKAYAESRPRIKGRFAKRVEVEPGDCLYGAAHLYGVVPTF